MNTNTICQCCMQEINHEEVLNENRVLFIAMDTGSIEEPTDLQEAIYLGAYCAGCIREQLSIAAACNLGISTLDSFVHLQNNYGSTYCQIQGAL